MFSSTPCVQNKGNYEHNPTIEKSDDLFEIDESWMEDAIQILMETKEELYG